MGSLVPAKLLYDSCQVATKGHHGSFQGGGSWQPPGSYQCMGSPLAAAHALVAAVGLAAHATVPTTIAQEAPPPPVATILVPTVWLPSGYRFASTALARIRACPIAVVRTKEHGSRMVGTKA